MFKPLKPLIRWTAVLALAAFTTACGVSPMPGKALGRTGEAQAAGRQAPVYDKIFASAVRPATFPVQIIAHRGFTKAAPENTLAAFEAAIAAGADAVELDVHLTKDGHLVVIHDGDVDRTTDGEGPVDEMTLAQIKALDAGSWFAPQFKGERVPTLDEALALIRGRANVVVEIKSRTSTQTPEAVASALMRHGMTNEATVISFYELPLLKSRSLLPQTATAALVVPLISPAGRAIAFRAGTALANHRNVSAKTVAGAHALGLKIGVWTVNEAETMREMIKAGVDGIITDDPALLRQVLDSHFNGAPAPVASPSAMPTALPSAAPLPLAVR